MKEKDRQRYHDIFETNAATITHHYVFEGRQVIEVKTGRRLDISEVVERLNLLTESVRYFENLAEDRKIRLRRISDFVDANGTE